MSKQASKTLIGAFVLGAIVLIVVAVMIFGSGKFMAKTYKYVLFFEGSVKGLQVGAPVVFRGVKIGQVIDFAMRLDPSDLSILIPVYVEIEAGTFVKPKKVFLLNIWSDQYKFMQALVDKGLRAQLQMQSFVTGQLVINLDFYPGKPVKLSRTEKKYPEIPTVPSDIEEVKRRFEDLPVAEIAERLRSALAGIEKIVNSPDMQKSVVTLNALLTDLDKLVREMNAQVVPLASNIDKLVREMNAQVVPLASNIDKLVKDVNARVEPLSTSMQKASDAAYAAFAQTEKTLAMQEGVSGQIAGSIKDTLASVRTTLQETQRAVRSIEDMVAQNPQLGYQAGKTLEDISALSRSLRSLVDYLERHPEALIKGKNSPKGE